MSIHDPRDQINTNARMLRADWIAEIDSGVQHMVPVIRRIFRPDGLLGFLADPFIDLAAVAFLKSSKRTGIKQMDITIQFAREAIETGAIDDVVKNHAKRFVDLDEMYVYGQKSHPRFKEMEKSIYDEFSVRAKETAMLLGTRPPDGKAITCAPDIYKIAYRNDVDKARQVHAQELGFIEDRLRMVREHDGLVSIPFGLRDKVLQVVAEGLQFTKDRYQQVLDRWFA